MKESELIQKLHSGSKEAVVSHLLSESLMGDNACGQQITTRIRRSGSSFTLRWLPGGRSWCMWMRTAM